MTVSHLRNLTARASEWDSRRRDWSKRDWSKSERKKDRDRDEFEKHYSLVRAVAMVLVVAWAVAVSALDVKLDTVTLAGLLWMVGLLLINPCRLCVAIADLARALRRLAALDLSPMVRERRSASASARAIAAAETGACVRFELARQVALRLAARLRAGVGTTVPTIHPRLATSLAAAAAALQRS